MYITKQISLSLLLLASGITFASEELSKSLSSLPTSNSRKITITTLGFTFSMDLAPEGNTGEVIKEAYLAAAIVAGFAESPEVCIRHSANLIDRALKPDQKYTYEELSK